MTRKFALVGVGGGFLFCLPAFLSGSLPVWGVLLLVGGPLVIWFSDKVADQK